MAQDKLAASSYWTETYQQRLEEIWGKTDRDSRKMLCLLTPREYLVYWGVVEGCSNEEIASHFNISLTTVGKYRSEAIPERLRNYRPLLNDPVTNNYFYSPSFAADFFAYSRSIVDHYREPYRLRKRDFTQALWSTFFGRLAATSRGNYPRALQMYEHAERVSHIERRDYERQSDLTLHFLGMLWHEIANARAMFSRRIKAVEAARLSLLCYELLASRANGTSSLSVKLGQIRGHVVEQQAEAYVAHSDRVAVLSEEIRRLSTFEVGGTEVTDHYGQAKSLHFEALCHWLEGKYDQAEKFARESLQEADRINPAGSVHWNSGMGVLDFVGLLLQGHVDLLWVWRDGLLYGKSWWQAIATATLADILACKAYLFTNEQMKTEARELYQRNRGLRSTPWSGSISTMPSAVGMYEWLIDFPDLMDEVQAREYLRVRINLADQVNMVYCKVQARLCGYHWYSSHSLYPDYARRMLDEASKLSDEDDDTDGHGSNSSLKRLVGSRTPIPQPR